MNWINIAIGCVLLAVGFVVLSCYLGFGRAAKGLGLMAIFTLAFSGARWLWGTQGELWFGIGSFMLAVVVYVFMQRKLRRKR